MINIKSAYCNTYHQSVNEKENGTYGLDIEMFIYLFSLR